MMLSTGFFGSSSPWVYLRTLTLIQVWLVNSESKLVPNTMFSFSHTSFIKILESLYMDKFPFLGTPGTRSGSRQEVIGFAEKWKICIHSIVASPKEGR
jgi:hypothetical protein